MQKNKNAKEIIDNLAEQLMAMDLFSALLPFLINPNIRSKSALCPFHNDSHLGSFSISSSKSVAKCFACGESVRNVIAYLMKKDGIKRNEAVLQAALVHNLINIGEYDELSKGTVFTKKEIKIREVQKKEIVQANAPASSKILNKVFKYFILGDSLIGRPKLNTQHLDYLYNRGLTKDDIIKGEFFTNPSIDILPSLIKKITEDEGLDVEVLSTIPGFFKFKDSGKWGFTKTSGIYFPIRNAKGEIVAIHRRNDESKGKSGRYFWMTSSFTEENQDKYFLGAKSLCPQDIMYPSTPKNTWKPYIIVVEGKFKALEVIKRANCITISIQGVGNLNGLKEELDCIIKTLNHPIKAAFIGYDADIDENANIYKHSCSLSQILESVELETYYYIWDSSLGKGIDDLFLNGNGGSLKVMQKNIFESIYSKILESSETKNEKNEIIIDKKQLRNYYREYILKI